MDVIRQKVYAINWQVKDGTIPGEKAVRILSTAPSVGELTSFTWPAFVGTTCRFPNAKALNAYSSLNPSVRVCAGKITSTKKRGGCRILHTALVRSAGHIIRSHSEGFGRWGYILARSSGRWRKATNAVGRKINTALYYMLLMKQDFSYEKYTIVKDAVIFDIPVDDLVQLNKNFKRYIQILKDNDINTTADMLTAYLSCSLGNVRGRGRKFFLTLQDFLKEQHKYQDEYKKLHPSWKITQTVVKGGGSNAQTQKIKNAG
ncbi:MAG: transposase [Synergistaceae bacterium]|nr:transposase [Synergistaceae bacterium]